MEEPLRFDDVKFTYLQEDRGLAVPSAGNSSHDERVSEPSAGNASDSGVDLSTEPDCGSDCFAVIEELAPLSMDATPSTASNTGYIAPSPPFDTFNYSNVFEDIQSPVVGPVKRGPGRPKMSDSSSVKVRCF
jgi:hypothetical protein